MIDERPLNSVSGTNFRDSILKIDGNVAVFRQSWRSKSSFFCLDLVVVYFLYLLLSCR